MLSYLLCFRLRAAAPGYMQQSHVTQAEDAEWQHSDQLTAGRDDDRPTGNTSTCNIAIMYLPKSQPTNLY